MWGEPALEKKMGAIFFHRDESLRPSSAFDVKSKTGSNGKAIANHLTIVVLFQIWKSPKKISRLYTEYYSDLSALSSRLKTWSGKNLLGGERKVYKQEYCHVHTIPLNRITLNLYGKIDQKNKEVWNAL